MFNQHFCEQFNVCSGFSPVAMNTNPGPTSDWVSLRDYGRCTFIFIKAAGTAGDDPTLSLRQATAVAGTSAKALALNTIYKKQAATNLFSVGVYTKSTAASSASNDTFVEASGTWTNSDLAEQTAIVVLDVRAEELDVDNGFDCVQVSIADVGTNAQLGTLIYILGEPRYQKDILISPIID